MTNFTVPSDTMTIQEAADLANVSRGYFVEHIINKGQVPCHRFGNLRKIYRKDLARYMSQKELETDEIMAELALLSQELRL